VFKNLKRLLTFIKRCLHTDIFQTYQEKIVQQYEDIESTPELNVDGLFRALKSPVNNGRAGL